MVNHIASYSRKEMEEEFGDNYNLDSFEVFFNKSQKVLILKTEMSSGIKASHQFQVRQVEESEQISSDMIIEDIERTEEDKKTEVICTNCDRTNRDVLEEIGFNTKNKVTSTTD